MIKQKRRDGTAMKKTYKIEVDCANCANKMEEAAKNTAGVKNATVNFMTLKMIVEVEEGRGRLRDLFIESMRSAGREYKSFRPAD